MRSCRSRRRVSLEPSNAGQVDAVENHGELRGGQFDPGGGGFGEVVTPDFQSLAPKTQTVVTPVQDLDPVGRAIGENEQVRQTRYFPAHVVGPGTGKGLHTRRRNEGRTLQPLPTISLMR